MEITELIEIVARAEDSKHQFKADVKNEISLAQEFVAFSNTLGGKIFIGISDDGKTCQSCFQCSFTTCKTFY